MKPTGRVSGPKSEARRNVIGVALLSAQPLFLNALSVPAMAFIIRRLGPSGYGQWAIATSLIGTVSILTNLGLRASFTREIARYPDRAEQALSQQLGTRLVLAVLAAGLVLLACVALGYSLTIQRCAAIAALGLVVSTGCSVLNDVLQGLERFHSVALANLLAGLLVTAASVIAIWGGAGPVGLTASYLTAPMVACLVMWIQVRRRGIHVSLGLSLRGSMQQVWASRQFTMQQVVGVIENNVAVLGLPKLIGPAMFGIFSAGSMLADRLLIIPDAIGGTLYPAVSRLHTHNPRGAIRHAWFGLLFGTGVCFCVALTGILLSGPIAVILFPKSPGACQTAIRITMWALPLAGANSAMGCALLAIGREAYLTRVTILGAIINVVIGATLILCFGVIGGCFFMPVRSAVRGCVILPEFVRAFLLPVLRRQHAPALPAVNPIAACNAAAEWS